jgi:hypothetical protein
MQANGIMNIIASEWGRMDHDQVRHILLPKFQNAAERSALIGRIMLTGGVALHAAATMDLLTADTMQWGTAPRQFPMDYAFIAGKNR